MGSGSRWVARALATSGALVVLVPAAVLASPRTDDDAVARAGVFVAADFPAGYQASAPSDTSHTDNLRLAKGVHGCGPYVWVQKALKSLPQAASPRYTDDTRSISNEVDVFESERAARSAVARYQKSSVVACLENLFEKQVRQDPDRRDSVDDVAVNLERRDIAGLGDDSVVYEGTMQLTATDGSTSRVGIGNAAVRVGRAVDAVTYSTTGGTLTDVLPPAIDASVSRLRSALAGS
jgi:hypothetical protein